MKTILLHKIGINNLILYSFIPVLILSVFLGVYSENYRILIFPSLIIIFLTAIIDFRQLYYFMLLSIPLTIPYYFPGNVTMDVPSEPLVVILMGITFYYAFIRKENDLFLYKHPIITLLCIHVLWTLICSLYSTFGIISLKFSLSKIWYVTTFTFLTYFIFEKTENYYKLFWYLFYPLFFLVFTVVCYHAYLGFTFESINQAILPFFENHVNYSTSIVVLFPFIWIAGNYFKTGFKHKILIISRYLFFVAIFFAFTRATWLSVIVSICALLLIKLKVLRYALITGILSLILFFAYLIKDNEYLYYAPNYTQTFYNKDDIMKHLEASYNMEDISGVERIYRWIAAFKMGSEKPFMGFGPGTFYDIYKSYTVTSFKTYVSDNPEKSGPHNYFLKLFAEQGIPGVVFFLLLIVFSIFYAEKLYYKVKHKDQKRMLLAVTLSILILFIHLLFGDMIEVMKIGPVFFICLALIIRIDLEFKKEKEYDYK